MTLESDQQLVAQLEECLVISYSYDEMSHTFVLVTDLINEVPFGDRDFSRITCLDARDFVRTPGLYKPIQRFSSSYSLRESVTTVIVQLAELTEDDFGYSLELRLGCDFGCVSVSCSALNAEIKRSKATQYEPDKWRYFDAESGVEFDFFAPFD